MVWIIGEYAERIDNADELLESFLGTYYRCPLIQILNCYLCCLVKYLMLCHQRQFQKFDICIALYKSVVAVKTIEERSFSLFSRYLLVIFFHVLFFSSLVSVRYFFLHSLSFFRAPPLFCRIIL